MRGIAKLMAIVAVALVMVMICDTAEATGRRRPVANALGALGFGRQGNVTINNFGGHGGHGQALRFNTFHGQRFNGLGFAQPRSVFVPFSTFGGFNHQPVFVPFNGFGHPVHGGSSTFFFRSGF